MANAWRVADIDAVDRLDHKSRATAVYKQMLLAHVFELEMLPEIPMPQTQLATSA